jgi:hypothetical protein
MPFKAGDRVTVTNPAPERAAYRGRTGTAIDDGSKSGGLIGVKGLDRWIREAVSGYMAFYADELTRV